MTEDRTPDPGLGGDAVERDPFRHEVAAWLAGILEAPEAAEVEAEIERRGAAGSRIVAEEAARLAELSLAVEPVAPPPALRARLLEAVAAEGRSASTAGHGTAEDPGTGAGAEPSGPAGAASVTPIRSAERTGGSGGGWRLALAAAAVAVLALGIWNVDLRRTLAEQEVALSEARSSLEVLDSLEAALQSARADFGTLASPSASLVSLAGTEDRPGARARVFVDPQTGRALVLAFDLPVLRPDQVYQLWALRDGVPSSVGTFAAPTTAESTARLQLDSMAPVEGADLFAVTIEPAPGQPAPTGTMVLISEG